MNLGAWKRLRSQMMSAAIDEMRLLHIFHFCQEASASPGVTWWVWEWWMWDDLSKISIALHKSGVPPRPRLNWTLGCLEILEQKRELVRALITVVTSFHIVCLTCAMLLTSLHLPFSLLLRQNHHFSFDSHQHLCYVDIEWWSYMYQILMP